MKRFGWALVLLSIFFVSQNAKAQNAESLLVDAVQLLSDGNAAACRDLLRQGVKQYPESDALWYYLSLSLSATGEDREAVRAALDKAVALDSTNYWYRHTQARLQPDLYEALVRDFPDKSDAVYELLEIYLAQKDYEKALEALDTIEREQGLSEPVVRTRYDVLTAMGRQEEGAEALEKFSQQYSLPSILSILGDYYLSDYADSLAQARYEEALSLDSSYIPAVLGMSEVYRHQRRYPDYFGVLGTFFSSQDVPAATKGMYISNMTRSLDPKILQLHREGFDNLVLTATEAHPSDSTLLSTAGTYYYSTGRAAEAGPWFQKAAQTYPESISLTATYIQYLALQENWEAVRDRSLEAFKRFQELYFLDQANLANYNLKDYDAIIGNCQFLLTNYPKDKQLKLGAYSMAGDAYHEKGNEKEAFRCYDKALKIDPDYAPVLNNYAYYLSLQGKKLKKAYAMSKKTVEANPDNATYLDTFAWILHLMGKDLEAKPFFKHAMLYGGKESAVILRHYATVLEALGESGTAQVYRSQAERLESKP